MGNTSNIILGVIIVVGVLAYFNIIEINDKKEIIIPELLEERIIPEVEKIVERIIPEAEKIVEVIEPIVPEPVVEPEISISELENKIEILINIEREKHGLQPLQSNALLREVAHSHSLDMAENSFFDHVNLDGQEPTHRGNEMGYICQATVPNPGVPGGFIIYSGIAENIYMHPFMENIHTSVVRGWMNSPGHRANILTAEYIFGEIGIARSGDEFYITHNFAVCEP